MNRPAYRQPVRLTWRVFAPRDGREIEQRLRTGKCPRCPGCGEVLEARPNTRLTRALILDATGYDLDCRQCRRFWCIVQHTPRSLRLLRMRRLVAAVRAVEPRRAGAAAPPAGARVAEALAV